MLPSQVSREVLGYSKTRVLSELKMVASDGSLFSRKIVLEGGEMTLLRRVQFTASFDVVPGRGHS